MIEKKEKEKNEEENKIEREKMKKRIKENTEKRIKYKEEKLKKRENEKDNESIEVKLQEIRDRNKKEEKFQKIKEEDSKILKMATRIKAPKNLIISENVLDFFSKDTPKEQIKEMVYNALGSSIVEEKSNYQQGKNLTEAQANYIIDVLYMNITNNEDIGEMDDNLLGEVKIKISFLELNSQNIKKIILKDCYPTKDDIKGIINQYCRGNNRPKLFVIELET